MKPIKARINSTGEVVKVRPYQTEIYDFMVCRDDGIMGDLYMRSELTIIGDNELDFISLVRRMRDAQKKCDRFISTEIKISFDEYQTKEEILKLESEVDEWLEKLK